jgi:hypothetical protein
LEEVKEFFDEPAQFVEGGHLAQVGESLNGMGGESDPLHRCRAIGRLGFADDDPVDIEGASRARGGWR